MMRAFTHSGPPGKWEGEKTSDMNTARIVLLMAVLALVFGAADDVSAGFIKGRYYKPLWSDYYDPPPFYPYSYETIFKGIAGVSVSASMQGNLPVGGAGGAETSTGEPVGYYEMSLAPGNYGVLFHEYDQWGPSLLMDQVVPSASPQELRLYPYVRYQNVTTGMAWDVFPAGTWSQSFVAKGNWITQVGLHQTQEFGPNVEVYVTADVPGPKSSAIGPIRTVATDVVNPSSVFWSAGEVPTTPGRTYCVNVFNASGFQMYIAGSRIQGGVAYPDGRVWKDYHPVSTMVSSWGTMHPAGLEMTIYEDTGGFISVVNTSKYNKPRNTTLQLATGCTVAGQTFVAMGTSLLSFSCKVANSGHSGGTLEVRCYQSPGANGEGVNQIGVAKYMRVPMAGGQLLEWNRIGAVWKPGEVPLTAGQSYYIKVKCVDGGAFDIWTTSTNEYAGGSFFKNGNETTLDLSTCILTEKFSGSMSQARIAISGINVIRGVNSATVNWTTDVATDTNYVDWGEETPYTKKTIGASGGTNHSVTLTGLLPNTQYHYRVVSKTAGKFDEHSRDFVFVTDPDQPNMLANPGFETGSLAPWTSYMLFGGYAGLQNYPWTLTGEPSFFGFQAHGGGWFFASAFQGATGNKGGVYQRVAVTPGDVLQFRGWVITYRTDPFPVSFHYESSGRVGIDPNGGTDPNASSIVWSPWVTAQDIVGAREEATGKGYWTEAYVKATAASNYVTVFFMAGADRSTRWDNWGFDDAMLTKVNPVAVTSLCEIATLPDGTIVRADDKIVTGSSVQLGANYIEDSNRVAGIRVESTELDVGYRISIQGTKGTKPSGEPYLYDVAVLSQVEDSAVKPMAARANALDFGKLGPSTVGLLMKAVGKINIDWDLNYYINDGSLPDPGLKLRTAPLFMLPDIGSTHSVTGVVSLEGTAPNARPILCPRDDSDLTWIAGP